MPKIITGGGKWKTIDISGECINDDKFTFLSSIEEYIPIDKHKNTSSSTVLIANSKGTNGDTVGTTDFKNEELGCGDVIVDELNEGEDEVADMSGWMNLCISDTILKAIADIGFAEPTEIQKLVIPSAIRDRRDIIGAAETGSGKTLAFSIPIVEHLLVNQSFAESSEQIKSIRALILAPTRELVMQIRNHIDALLKYTPFKVASIVGGLSLQKQERILKYVPEIVIATPGRFLALMTSAEANSYLSNWSHLQCLVIDETDRMIEKGHFEDLQQILDIVKRSTSKKLQTFVFSATLTYTHYVSKRRDDVNDTKMNADEKINRLIEITGIRKEKHKIIDITGERGIAKRVIESRINCKNLLEKDTNLIYLLNRYVGRTLVFTNSVDASRRLHGILKQLNHKPGPLMLHAKMIQKKRLKTWKNLLNFEYLVEENSVLLATDLAARGLDIRDVQHVIHYQLPKTAELYIHRCGRTARATKEGLAILLIDSQDVFYYQRICKNLNRETLKERTGNEYRNIKISKYFGIPINVDKSLYLNFRKEFPIFPLDSPELYDILKKRVEIATAIHSKQAWFEKAAANAELDLDESKNERIFAKREKILTIQLNRLLSLPLPANKVHVTKTRYVTSAIASNYDKLSTQDAITSLMENVKNEEVLKKKCRNVCIGHYKTSRRKKRKRMKR
ncbi:hypothetical protein DINM_001916 [Dirofilaria immitis]|nr:hypothetical protein [Dirofilaria immitis]